VGYGVYAQDCQSVIEAPVLVQYHTSHSEVHHSDSSREEEAYFAGGRRTQVEAADMVVTVVEASSEGK